MNAVSSPPAIGIPVKTKQGQWVQTERKAHEEWALMGLKKPIASAVLHKLVAAMGHQNAVVISQKLLAQMLGVHDRSISRAIADLAADRWIQVVRIGKGKEAAYVVNDAVAWGQPREQLRLSAFSATIVADAGDQDAVTLGLSGLRRIPTLFPGEQQLPSGPGMEPPSQPSIPGMEPDLPAIVRDDSGQQWAVDKKTGELQGLLPDRPVFSD